MLTTLNTTLRNTKEKRGLLEGIKTNYLEYVALQSNQRIYWLMKAIIVIPSIYLVLATIAIAQFTDHFEWFIGLSTLVFFSNIVVHIADCKSLVYVSLFHLSTLFFILVPFAYYLIVG